MDGWGPSIYCVWCATPMAWDPKRCYWRHVETGTPADEGCEFNRGDTPYRVEAPNDMAGRDYVGNRER